MLVDKQICQHPPGAIEKQEPHFGLKFGKCERCGARVVIGACGFRFIPQGDDPRKGLRLQKKKQAKNPQHKGVGRSDRSWLARLLAGEVKDVK